MRTQHAGRTDGWTDRRTDGQTETSIPPPPPTTTSGGVIKVTVRNAKFGSKSAIFCPVWPWNLMDDLEQGKSEGFDSCDLTQIGFKSSIFQPVWPWNLMDDPKNRAPLLCYFKLFASFRSQWWIQTGVTVQKRLIWVKIDAFLSRVTLKFDGWPSKTIGHLFYATSSFVHHFVATGEFKLELESGNVQSGSNATLFRAVWPWNLTDDLEKQ